VEEVTVSASHKVSMEAGDDIALIAGNPQGNLSL